jgi:hypothetical protein
MKLQSEQAAAVRYQSFGFASSLFVGGVLLATFVPMTAFAREHGSESRGGSHSSSSVRSSGQSQYSASPRGQAYSAPRYSAPAERSHGSATRSYSQAERYSAPAARSYSQARRGYAAAPRGYERERSDYRGGYYRSGNGGYYRGGYGGYYRGGIYVAPYSYGYYDSGYAYAPVTPACTEGAYDAYGNWVPSPNCYAPQQQYQAAPSDYYTDEQQYPQQQQQYQQPYPQQQQYQQQQQQQYAPNQPPYGR